MAELSGVEAALLALVSAPACITELFYQHTPAAAASPSPLGVRIQLPMQFGSDGVLSLRVQPRLEHANTGAVAAGAARRLGEAVAGAGASSRETSPGVSGGGGTSGGGSGGVSGGSGGSGGSDAYRAWLEREFGGACLDAVAGVDVLSDSRWVIGMLQEGFKNVNPNTRGHVNRIRVRFPVGSFFPSRFPPAYLPCL